jgi:choline dehydrogenase
MYDTIILGAGSAGCVLANRLTEDPDRQVLLLEAGGDAPINSKVPSDWITLFNTQHDWGYHTVAQPGARGRRIFWPRGKMVGGSGAMNAMIYIRGLPSDYDGWAQNEGCPGWDWASMLEDFIASESNAQFGNEPLHGASGPLHVENPTYKHPYEQAWVDAGVAAGFPENSDFNGVNQEGFGFFQLCIRDGMRAGPNRAYLEPIMDRDNLTLEKHVRITRIVIEKGRAVGVEFLRNGRFERVRAENEVVVATGALNTPHLLMLSGLGPSEALTSHGIEVLVDSPEVGQNLQDHISVPISYYTREDTGVGSWDAAFLEDSFNQWQKDGTGPRSVPWAAAGAHVTTQGARDPDLQLYGVVSPHRDYGRFLADRAGMTMHTVLQRPKSQGEVTLASSDPIEAPLVDPKYFSSDPSGQDISKLVEGIRIQRRVAETGPLADLLDEEMQPSVGCQSDDELAEHIRGHCMTLYHAACTCRMGTDEAAVVDSSTLKFNGVENLYVADASVMPRMVSGNIQAAVIAIAERAARSIRNGGAGFH